MNFWNSSFAQVASYVLWIGAPLGISLFIVRQKIRFSLNKDWNSLQSHFLKFSCFTCSDKFSFTKIIDNTSTHCNNENTQLRLKQIWHTWVEQEQIAIYILFEFCLHKSFKERGIRVSNENKFGLYPITPHSGVCTYKRNSPFV